MVNAGGENSIGPDNEPAAVATVSILPPAPVGIQSGETLTRPSPPSAGEQSIYIEYPR
jgi:hypothetical protein